MVIPHPVKPDTLSTLLKPYLLKLRFNKKVVDAEVIHIPSSAVACSASTMEKSLGLNMPQISPSGAAAIIGKILGERLMFRDIPDVSLELIDRHHSDKAKVIAFIESLKNTGVKLL